MKTKFLWIAFLASAAIITQVKAQVVRRGGGGVHAGAAPHVAAAAPTFGAARWFCILPFQAGAWL
jgi:hypothetical protein